MEQPQEDTKFVSASDLLEKLFSEILIPPEFNPEIAALTKIHLGSYCPLSKAGNNLANALIELAKKQSSEVIKNDLDTLST